MPIRGTRLAHDAQQGGAHKVPPFFSDRPSRMRACVRCVFEPRSGNRGGSGEWLLGVIWQAEEPANPKSTWMFCVVVCVSTYSAMPVRVDITVGSVDSNRYSRCTACVAERTLRDSVSGLV